MTENVFTPHTEPPAEPTLRRNLELPKGVLQKNLKTFVYLGAALLVIVAALFSSSGKKTPGQQAERERATPATSLAGQHRQQRTGVEEPTSGRTSERAAGDNGRRRDGRSGACVCDAPAAIRSRGLWTDRPCRALHSGPALPASAAGQHADATHARATAGTVDRSERTRAGGRLPFRFQSCVLPLCRSAPTTTARPDDARPIWPCRTAGKQ